MTLAATFVLGFSVVFVALGASATALGSVLLSYKLQLGVIAGVVVILFGLHLLGLTPFRLMNQEARFHLDTGGGRAAGAFVLGIAFAFGWTPCIGPVLGAILTLSASTADVAKGSLLLAVYSLGLGLPFLLAALFTGTLLARFKALGRAGRNLQRRGRPPGRDGSAHGHGPARGGGVLAARDLPGARQHRLRFGKTRRFD